MNEEIPAKRSGGRSARIAKRSAPPPPESRAVKPGLSGGAFQPLNIAQLEKILDSALNLLEEVGMAQAIPEFIDLVTSNGGTYTSEERLLFPKKLVRSMIDAAAKEFTLFGFDEKHNLEIGGDRVHFSTGGAAVLMLDHETSTFRDSQLKDIFNIGRIIEKLDVVPEIEDIPSKKIKELIDFSYGSPGRYLINLQSWLSISIPLRQKLEVQSTNEIELLQLAKGITDELNIEQQLWLIDFQQNKTWINERNSHMVKKFEELRKQLLKYVQPRLAWEVTLLDINLIN